MISSRWGFKLRVLIDLGKVLLLQIISTFFLAFLHLPNHIQLTDQFILQMIFLTHYSCVDLFYFIWYLSSKLKDKLII